ncbi:hypothetical protein IFM89_029714 [Coptis chinensis]|uniref:Nuclear pore complex protein NUP133 n=1 Tax=Coptis chinensis TaxID=261450 RepID=A0A835H1P7_9MAGN|nr:hypothetical protein IFM89_029714 [Coptis chinensis]
MFSPGTRRRPHHNLTQKTNDRLNQSPSTPPPINNNNQNDPLLQSSSLVPNRPSTGTPAPWLSRLSVLARIPAGKKTENEDQQVQPVYVGEFPEEVRNAQASFLHKSVVVTSEIGISGGIDKCTSLSWIICDNRLFVWSFLSPVAFKKCAVLDIPFSKGGSWIVCVVSWNGGFGERSKYEWQSNPVVGIVMCNKNSQDVIYWPDIYAERGSGPVVSGAESGFSPSENRTTPTNSQKKLSRLGSSYMVEKGCFNSLIATEIPDREYSCVALAAGSDGELWQFECSPSGVIRKKISLDYDVLSVNSSDGREGLVGKGYPRSLIWRFQLAVSEESNREFFLLTDHKILCFRISFDSKLLNVSKLWSHEIVGTDNDMGIKKDLAGEKRIWPLDMQIDDHGKEITILVATFCKDRVSSSSYTQYSLLTMQYRPGINTPSDNGEPILERVLEKKAPVQVIMPKARVEDENFLFSMKLRVGGKPSGSAIILSGDGTATVSYYRGNATRLYQFDLPWDAGKVLDASVFPSKEDVEEGAWVVVTEKAGVWAIPEKAVLLGGVDPPERSLSRKGSSNEGAAEEEKWNLALGGSLAPRRASSEAWDAGDRRRALLTGIIRPTAQDEESEALLGRLFHDFLLSGQVGDSLEKLRRSGAFEKDEERNVFTRMSKSIVDTLAKHWTTTRGTEIVAMSVVSSQLADKQQKHHKFLQFLALSRCHEELSSRQKHSLQIIMEHGEKLSGIIQLRELQSILSQNRSNGTTVLYSDSPDEMAGSLWDLIQLVGEQARHHTVLLMDRDNAEVFYSKVSDLQEVFNCISHHLQYFVGGEQPTFVQIQRVCELSDACTVLIRASIQYRNEYNNWYPLPEGLMSWYCKPVVRDGLWCIASFMLQLLKDSADWKEKSPLYSHLESLTDVLLESYSGAITAKVEREEEHKGLLGEYWKRRDTLLASLYQHIKSFVDDKYLHPTNSMEESKEDILRKYSLPLLSISKRHEGYETLWSICCDLNDSALLRNLMHESVGPKGGFSYFVFTKLHERRQFAKLLRLGEEFPEELTIFLRQHKDILWLHDMFLNHFSSASETLHALALSEAASEEGSDPGLLRLGSSLGDRKRLLNVSKIAAMAGKDDEFVMKTKRIEADLRILNLQQEIIEILSDNNEKPEIGQGLVPPGELIKLCLGGNTPKLCLCAFEVFAWTSSSFRLSNRGLLEECWRNAADLDDWGSLHQASTEERWSDEETLQILSETVLSKASNRCYGPMAESYEGGFDEVLPLRQEDVDLAIVKDPNMSVEAMMMHHKNFPDAGKLMLTAIMLGQVGTESVAEEQGSPME